MKMITEIGGVPLDFLRRRGRTVLVIAGSIIGVVALGFYLHNLDLLGPVPEHSLEFTTFHLVGWAKEKKSWELTADEGWVSTRGDDITLENIQKGTLYQFGHLSGKDLVAAHVQIHQRLHEVEARPQKDGVGRVVSSLTGWVDVNAPTTSEEAQARTLPAQWASIKAGYIRYNTENKIGVILEGVTVRNKGNTIKSPSATFNHQAKTIEFMEEPSIRGRRFRFRLPKLSYEYKEGMAYSYGDIRGTVFPKTGAPMSVRGKRLNYNEKIGQVTLSEDVHSRQKGTVIQAGSFTYDERADRILIASNTTMTLTQSKTPTEIRALYGTVDPNSETATLEGQVVITQPGKVIMGSMAVYSASKNQLIVSGLVQAYLDAGRTLIKKETAEKIRNREALEALQEKTQLACSYMVVSTVTGDLDLRGNVLVNQNRRQARASRGTYDDKKELITLHDDVYLAKGPDWLKAQKVLVSVKDQTFEAQNQVETQFRFQGSKEATPR